MVTSYQSIYLTQNLRLTTFYQYMSDLNVANIDIIWIPLLTFAFQSEKC